MLCLISAASSVDANANTEPNRQPDSTVYESFENLFKALEQVKSSLSSNYQKMVSNDTDAMSNWFAYSHLLKPINRALMDNLFPVLLDQSDLEVSSDCMTTLFDFATAIDQQKSWAYRSKANFFYFITYIFSNT